MKRFIALLLLISTLVCAFVGCNNEEDEKPETTDEQTAKDTDVTTEEHTAADTSEQTTVGEETTEEEEETHPIPTTYEGHLAEIYRKTPGNTVEIGGFLTPVDMNQTKPVFEKLRECGITYMVTSNEFYGTVMLSNTLRAADETGMGLSVWTFANVYNANDTVEKLKLVVDHPSVKYLYLWDEPVPAGFGTVGTLKKAINKNFPDVDWKIGSNMLPGPVYETYKGGWYGQIESYLKIAKPDYLCFDHYPWVYNEGNNMRNFLQDLALEKLLCDKYDVEMWTFIQTSGFDTCVVPTEGKLRYQVNACLAFGCENLVGFLCCANESKYSAIIDPDGKETDFYYDCKSVFNDVHNMKGVFLDYNSKGLIFVGESAIVNRLNEKQEISDSGLIIDGRSYGALKSVDASQAIVSCMTKTDGEREMTGFYVVNSDYTNDQKITLEFDSKHTYQIWNRNGLESMGSADSVTLDMIPGDGAFVMIDTENDSTAYPEPAKKPKTEVKKIPTAQPGTMLFDLGFDADGKIYNKVENSYELKSICEGTYGETDGKPTLNKYSIYTTDMLEANENGLTFELYVKLADKANKKWFTVYSDPNANCNLYRISDKSTKYKPQLCQGCYDGSDIIVDDVSADMPVDTWLHIVATYSSEGQYVYVNGKKVSEGHNANPGALGNSVIFKDPDGVAYLNTARVYSYAANESQISEMYKNAK